MHAYAIEHNLNYELLTDWDMVFSDVSADNAAYSAICHTVDRGIFVGTSATTFSPDMTLTRAMFVTTLARMLGADVSAYTEPIFDDVPADAWYAPYAAWAVDTGIVLGIGDNRFGGELPIDIGQACLILVRHRGYQIVSNTGIHPNTFPDYEKLPQWSENGICWAVENGICWAVENGLYKGKDGMLCPDAPLTRAEAAELLSNYNLLFYGK